MSDGGKAFRTYILTKTGVSSLISTRMYPDYLPQTPTLPAVVYHVISNVPEHHLGGAAALTTLRIQANLYATSRSGANTLAEAMRNAANGYTGAMGAEYAQTCRLDVTRYDTDEPADGSDLHRYVVSQDWILSITETAPTL
jgi:hypothetical protein